MKKTLFWAGLILMKISMFLFIIILALPKVQVLVEAYVLYTIILLLSGQFLNSSAAIKRYKDSTEKVVNKKFLWLGIVGTLAAWIISYIVTSLVMDGAPLEIKTYMIWAAIYIPFMIWIQIAVSHETKSKKYW